LARSPIAPAEPVEVRHGWQVSARRCTAALQLSDRCPLAKVAVRPVGGAAASRTDSAQSTAIAEALGTGFGQAVRRADGVLVVGSGPGEWLLLGAPGTAGVLIAGAPPGSQAVDLTHGRALVRLTGADAARTLSKVCAIDLRDRATANGAAFRSTVAKVVTDVVRDDLDGVRSYLLHCERSSGQYFFDALLDAGQEFGIDVAGFSAV
jgi:heterotetrameric sarcosine oxidase gamma subunit